MSTARQKIFIEYKDMPTMRDVDLILKNYQGMMEKVTIISFDEKALEFFANLRLKNKQFAKIKILALKVFALKSHTSFDGLDVHKMPQKIIKQMNKDGKFSSIWTIDGVAKIQASFLLGFDFITTNDIQLCQVIKKKLFL